MLGKCLKILPICCISERASSNNIFAFHSKGAAMSNPSKYNCDQDDHKERYSHRESDDSFIGGCSRHGF